MLALTVLQPWAFCIAAGHKTIENRTWKPPERAIGQRIAIHAGKRWDEAEALSAMRELTSRKMLPPPMLSCLATAQDQCGCVVATAMLSGYGNAAVLRADPWFHGPIGWILKDVRRLPEPIPVRGMQGLWTLPPAITDRLVSDWRAKCSDGSSP